MVRYETRGKKQLGNGLLGFAYPCCRTSLLQPPDLVTETSHSTDKFHFILYNKNPRYYRLILQYRQFCPFEVPTIEV